MSSTVVTPKTTSELRKRSYCPSDDETCSEPPSKYAASLQWYQVVLESESSKSSEHDTESVLSIQDKETDYARDTSDTDATDTDVEYEVASLSEDDEHVASFWGDLGQSDSSSGTDDVLGDVEMLAAICKAAEEDSDVGLWAADTDGESSQQSDDLDASRSSRLVASRKRPPLLLKCVQCKGVNDNPFYRYCEKCYQARKKIFPPRPRRHRTRDKLQKKKSTLTEVNATSEENITSADKIIVPDELIDTKTSSQNITSSQTSKSGDINEDMLNEKEMCIVCTTNPKNGIFVHGTFGHMCCCYKCAVKVWTRTKRCPACNCKVKNVLKVFLR
ncbi:E3 ubiquitin-protein ligase Mdm2-like isoform X2 [Chrysoperla carnea]|uniref:E3 ubiquitin-protein ligase Mdm2-like isoform X2 n=1 Tax=Chrysoperla carnea TaxID=189513 RepID=UPI001D079D49|nr:E3 ubiquitin-protein ligase Mdm2-like isoform X2 [Chrysoperla carnea]